MKVQHLFLVLASFTRANGFAPSSTFGCQSQTNINSVSTMKASSTSTETDDILKPKYEIEDLPMRIGHGFDIHRMAPIEDAGQPVVIGGVTIDHKDQKVRILVLTL